MLVWTLSTGSCFFRNSLVTQLRSCVPGSQFTVSKSINRYHIYCGSQALRVPHSLSSRNASFERAPFGGYKNTVDEIQYLREYAVRNKLPISLGSCMTEGTLGGINRLLRQPFGSGTSVKLLNRGTSQEPSLGVSGCSKPVAK